MSDIPDQPVGRGVEDVVQRHRQFDDAEPGTEMAAGHRYGIDQLGAQLVGELTQILFGQLAQFGRNRDAVEQRRAVRDGIVRLTIQLPAP